MTAALSVACGGDTASGPGCVTHAVATDIDETLTTSDNQWFAQLQDGTFEPEMRPEANTLLQDYADLGYAVIYVTARGQDITLTDGRTATDATQQWLDSNDFPTGDLFLAEGAGALGPTAVEYKSDVLSTLQDDGWQLDYGYGNAESDIDAFLAVGIASIFHVGRLVGTLEVPGIPDEEAYATHRAAHMSTVPDVHCE